MEIGEYNQLEVLREAEHGFYLGDDEGNDVLIPMKWAKDFEIGSFVEVFVYVDSTDRPIATTMKPFAEVGEFAVLKVKNETSVGAFLDWGLEKDLLAPFKEQAEKMQAGKEYLVWVYLDQKTDRVVATSKLNKVVSNEELELKEGEEVDIRIWKKTDLGYSVIVNDEHLGLIYHHDIFDEVEINSSQKAFVKRIKNNNQLDISFQKFVHEMIEPNSQMILDKLKAAGGSLPFNDKTDPQTIQQNFKMSKKSFKRAIGNLFKKRLIQIGKSGIRLGK